MISESKGWFGQGAHQRKEKAAIIAPIENKSVLVDKIIENSAYVPHRTPSLMKEWTVDSLSKGSLGGCRRPTLMVSLGK